VIRLTRHARERVDAGEIKEEWIAVTVLAPTLTQRDARRPNITLAFRAIPESGGRILRVAFRAEGTDVAIVTAFFDRGAKL
jgi:hypothetical protein